MLLAYIFNISNQSYILNIHIIYILTVQAILVSNATNNYDVMLPLQSVFLTLVPAKTNDNIAK